MDWILLMNWIIAGFGIVVVCFGAYMFIRDAVEEYKHKKWFIAKYGEDAYYEYEFWGNHL